MKDATDVTAAQDRFAAAVRDYTPKLPPKFQALMPFKEGIAELRRKHASYRTIAEILGNMDVSVSHDMVARFCKEVLELTPPRRSKRKGVVRAGTPTSTTRVHRQNKSHGDVRGPRVADPNDI